MKTTEVIVSVFMIAFLMIGLVFVIITIFFNSLNKKTKFWKRYSGEIIKSELKEKEYIYSYDIDEYNSSKEVSYKLHVVYRYIVGNVEYQSDKVYASKINNYFLTKSDINKLKKKYFKDKKIDVYVNPKDRSDSILINQIQLFDKILLFFLFIFLAIVVFFFKNDIINLINQ